MRKILNRLRRTGWPCVLVVAGAASAFADSPSFSVSGDARVRYEDIDVEPGSDVSRERYRARFGLDSEFSDALTLHVRLATGTGDPVSTNLNFGESFSLDDVQLDRAWLDWRVNDSTRLHIGKMKNPLYRAGDTALTWDADWNPEGVAVSYGTDVAHAVFGAYQLADQGDEYSRLFASQVGTQLKLRDDHSLRAGIAYYDFTNTRGRKPFYRLQPTGNTVDGDGNHVFDYDIVELYVEYGMSVLGFPLKLFGDWARNLDPDRENRAWAFGVSAGSAGERGDLFVSWERRDTQADALIGTFTESDFAGGNTDSRGDTFGVEYKLTDNLSLGGTLILSEFGHFRGQPRDFDRVMLDMEFSF